MKHYRSPIFLALATLLAGVGSSGCGASSAATTVDDPVGPAEPPAALELERPFFVAGEVMRFELSLHKVVGGEAVLAVGQPGQLEGREVVVIRSRAKTTGVAALVKEVRDDVTTWIDVVGGHPVRLHADVKFGKREAVIATDFAGGKPGGFAVDYARRGKTKRRVRQSMPAGLAAYDAHSALGAIRGWLAPDGSQSYFYVLAGKRLWYNDLEVVGREKITTKMGRFAAVRLEGNAWRLDRRLRRVRNKKVRSYTVWISADERRLPLRVAAKTEYGDVIVELVDHTVGELTARAF